MSDKKELEGISGIFVSEHQMSNMKMERIVVSDPAIKAILKVTQLSQAAQEEAVNLLVARTPEWLDIEPEEQIAKIKAVLTQESVIEYLKVQGTIRSTCDMVEVGIDIEGSIIIEAFYTSLNREQRRLINKSVTKDQKEKMKEAMNIFSGFDDKDNLIDLAAKKLERMQKAATKKPTVRAVIPPKKK